ncbi:ABC transporter substrate-binding protein, partial [Clostridium perfringens]|nr:ABC transporter substrate-binding protein [Clostridium perfringens]
MKIKKLTSILLAATLTLGLVACGGNSKNTSDKTDNKNAKSNKITIWAWDESFNIVAANKAKEIYKKDHPDAEIEVVTMAQNDIVAKLNTSLSSGSYEGLPNVVLVEDYRIQGYLTSYKDEF